MEIIPSLKNLFSKTQFYLIIILILIFPIGELSRINLGNAVAFTLNDLIVGVVAVLFFINLAIRKKNNAKLTRPIIFFSLTSLISLFINYAKISHIEFLISFSYIFRWIFYSTIYLTVVKFSKKDKNRILNFISIMGFITVLFGFVQLILYPNLRNLFYAGWDEHLYRIFTGFLDPNFSGVIFVLLFILLLIRYSHAFKKFKENKKNFYLVLLGLVFFGIILTFSRTAILAFFVSLILFAVYKKDRYIGLALILLAIIAATIFLIVPKKESNNVFRTTSTFSRVTNYKEGLTIFSHNPVFGVGFDSYRYALLRYGYKDKEIYGPSHGASGNDNSFIFVLATEGIVGFLAYIYLFYRMFKIKDEGKVLRSLSVVVAIISGLFINGLFFVFIMEWIWIILASTENT